MIDRNPWPFREPRDMGVFTTRQVFAGVQPIVRMTHENGVGGWSFLHDGAKPEDIIALTLEQMSEVLNPADLETAIQLPLQARATRASVNDPWIRELWEKRKETKTRAGRRSGTPRKERD